MLAQKLAAIKKAIRGASRRHGQQVLLVAVTKKVSVERIRAAQAAGVQDFGENRVQEALPKIKQLAARWHFIGHLQTNKAREVVGNFDLLHSLDRWKLARELDRWGARWGKVMPVLVQLNLTGDRQRFGVAPEELFDFLTAVGDLSFLQVKGLMAMAPFADDPEETRPYFRRAFALYTTARERWPDFNCLSMGMSNDYLVAVEEGANIVRLGTILFGERGE